MAIHRVVTIHHNRMTLNGVDGVYPLHSYAATLRFVLAVVDAMSKETVHVELELAPGSLIVCRRCGVQYDHEAWKLATYFDHEHAKGMTVETRRCACGVDLTPEHTLLRSNPTSN